MSKFGNKPEKNEWPPVVMVYDNYGRTIKCAMVYNDTTGEITIKPPEGWKKRKE